MNSTEKELLTIKEFAELAGVSKQAIYSQLDKRLKPFLVQVDNKKMLKSQALEQFYSINLQSTFNQPSSQVESSESVPSADERSNEKDKETILKMLEMLQEEIKKKDKQIERLQDSLDKAYITIGDLASKAQYITAADKTAQIMDKQMLDKKTSDSPKEIIEETDNKPKKSFWKRVFGR